MISREERDRKVKVLLENENRQPADDQELEKLQAMQKFSEVKPKGEKSKSQERREAAQKKSSVKKK